MKKLNPNSNNNHYVQMKQSQVKESNYGSQNSDVLSLTSNNSDIIVNKSENQIEAFKQKMSHLLGTRVYESLDDLYSKIKEKVGSKLIKQTLTQLSGMEAALGRVKKNNRQMAKLVTVLGTKAEKQPHQKQKISKPKKKQKGQQANLKFSKVGSESSTQFYNYHYKKRDDHQSSNQSAGQQYSSSFLKNKKQTLKEDSKGDSGDNDRIRYVKPKVRDTLEQEYKWKNRIYEQKVREMLMELGNIKKELGVSHHLPSRFNTVNNEQAAVDNRKVSKKSKTVGDKILSSIDTRLNAKSPQDEPNSSTNHQQERNSAFNPKIVVSEQISSEEITVEKEQKQDKKEVQIKLMGGNNKGSTDTSNNGEGNARREVGRNGREGNSVLIEKARGISKMLQQIKAQLTQPTTRSPLPSMLQQCQKTNIQLLDSHTILSQPSNPQLFKQEYLTRQQRQLSSQIDDDKSEQKNNRKKEVQQQQQQRVEKKQKYNGNRKDSVVGGGVGDNRKNEQKKKDMVTDNRGGQWHGRLQPQRRGYNSRLQTPSFTFLPLQHHNLPSSTTFKQKVSNCRPTTTPSTHPYIVSYSSSLTPVNSFNSINQNTSSSIITMNNNNNNNNNNRPPINKRPSSQVRSYQTSNVVPVAKVGKQRMLHNQQLVRTPSFYRLTRPPLIAPYNDQFHNSSFVRDKSRSIVRVGRSFSQKNLSNQSLSIPHQTLHPQIVIYPTMSGSKKKLPHNIADPYTVTLGSSFMKQPKRRSSSIGSHQRSRSKGIDVYSSKQK